MTRSRKVSNRWLSVEDVAKHLQVAAVTIYRWLAERDLPAHRLGKLWRFKLDEVDAWAAAQGKANHEGGALPVGSAPLEPGPDFTFVIDNKYRYVDFVASARERPFVEPQDFIGKTIAEVLPQDVAARCMHYCERALATDQLQRFSYELPLDDGPHEYDCRLMVSDRKQIVAFVRDVTHQTRHTNWRT